MPLLLRCGNTIYKLGNTFVRDPTFGTLTASYLRFIAEKRCRPDNWVRELCRMIGR